MEDGQVVDILDVALLKVRRDTEPVPKEVQGVQRLCLRLRDGWDIAAAGQSTEPHEISTSILQDNSLWGRSRGGLVVEEGACRIGFVGVVEPENSVSGL